MLDVQQHAILSLPPPHVRPTFAISTVATPPSTPSSRLSHRVSRRWSSRLRANMSSCLNLNLNLRRAMPATDKTSAAAAAAVASPLHNTNNNNNNNNDDDAAEPQDENEVPPLMCEIGMPYDLKHDVHVHYNFQEARFEGVSPSFAEYIATSSGLLSSSNTKSSAPSGNAGNMSPVSALSAFARSTTTRVKRSRTGSSSAGVGAFTSAPTTLPLATTSTVSIPTTTNTNNTGTTGEPADPLALLNQHFQVPYRQVPRRSVVGYSERIPAVLVMLHDHFVTKRGHLAPHIFRESPNKAERDRAIREINSGTFAGADHDVRVLADLLKLWFRELPVPVFHAIRPDEMEQLVAAGGDVAAAVLTRLGPLEQSIVLWFADALAHVAAFQTTNHMGVDQLAIVIAPNLVRIETANPMLAVALSKASVDLFRAVLRARFNARQQALDALPQDGEVTTAVAATAVDAAPVVQVHGF